MIQSVHKRGYHSFGKTRTPQLHWRTGTEVGDKQYNYANKFLINFVQVAIGEVRATGS